MFIQLENSNTYVSVYKIWFDYDNKMKARTEFSSHFDDDVV